jgi:drug/metabolite transporter (DMT)-like permease
MVGSLFFVYMAAAIISYGAQNSFHAKYARMYDTLMVSLVRNVSLIVTMLPLLFFTPLESTLEVFSYPWTLFFASLSGAISLWSMFSAARYLPIGISSALRQMVNVTTAITLGVAFMGEFLTLAQLSLLTIIVAVGVSMSLTSREQHSLHARYVWRGIGLTLFAGFSVGCSFYFFSVLSRELHPFAATYFWEAAIGVWIVAFYCIRLLFRSAPKDAQIPWNDAIKIMAISLLTISGTLGYSYAVVNGPFALASGLLSMNAFVATVFGWFLYKERLSRIHLGLIAVAVVCIISLNLVS